MHFIGMLAFRLPIPMSYDVPITLFSLLIAVVTSWFALYLASRSTLSQRRLVSGGALMGIGIAGGENRCADAAKAAISSPLLEESVDGATGILLNITGGKDLGLFEVNDAAEIIQNAADPNANIIFGAVIDESMSDDVRVTVIGTGFDHRPGRSARRDSRARRPDRGPRIDDRQRSSLEISEDDIDVPPFLR